MHSVQTQGPVQRITEYDMVPLSNAMEGPESMGVFMLLSFVNIIANCYKVNKV